MVGGVQNPPSEEGVMNVNGNFDLATATFIVLLITLVVTLVDKIKK